MNRKRLLKHLVFLMFFMFLADFLAHYFFWYSLISYFDVIMHTLGGFWVGMFFFYIFSMGNGVPRSGKLFLRVVLCTLMIGLLWEFFEYVVFNIIAVTSWDGVDTSSDIFFDILGALFSCFYFSKFIMSAPGNGVQSR